ncbi:HTH-type transcriptional regulator sinR [Anaerococcus octavius]|uniref:HTH-type transcriptional regulator sinR n=1 Tax=Anaerococcus octavius TaxID=54007 RepID=A0A380WT49_9FIRM|nr:helix-turn-helix transcriptional regulator [Anaerococcus octavius]SUU92191.1 HTH-type transcriptional regulator sinR [Anaerococcus octavius]
MSIISENIAFYRRKKGLTQKDLAEKTGLSRSFISQIENATNNASDDSLYKISNVLDVSVSELKGNDKSFVKNEDTELINLLIKITADEKILWEKFEDPSNYYDCTYKCLIRGTEYNLNLKYKFDNNELYIRDITLSLNDYTTEFSETIISEEQDNRLLFDLVDTIQNLERDRSPKFKLINELEEIEKDDEARPDNTGTPF